ncbi:MAG TPA: hydroxysqualene dehydroxylase HpnE [Candidatus Binataceae bacterium]|nr:hydroxysqualene dehydroxylase HpnE [Candidatus Binataceae bacterium]
MSEKRDVAVVGGGFAGLSAGVALAERGFRVAVVERKPALGGRAYSFQDPDSGDFIDNGQHVLMGCYGETLDFLGRIGTRDQLFFHPNLEIEMLELGGRRGWLRTAPVPGPFHMSAALLRYRLLTPRERWRVMAGSAQMLRLRRRDPAALECITVAALMDRLGQGARERACFWYPLATATLNEDPEIASAALLAEVIKRAFFGRRSDSAFVYSRVGLSDLYCTAATEFIERRSGVVALHSAVETLELGADAKVSRIRMRDGSALQAANFVLAVAVPQLLRLLPRPLADDPFFAAPQGLGVSPIICVHVWLDREITDAAFIGFIGTATQWLFNKRRIFAQHGAHHGGYLSFVISGARQLVDRSNDELLELVMSDLRAMIPEAHAAKIVKALVIKEKQATMAPDLKSHRLRPGTVTPIKNLFLAGDWIQTGLPATIESAVVSGRMAAAAVAARVGVLEAA